MRGDPDHQVQVAGRRAARALAALAGQPDALAVGDPRRDGDLDGPVAAGARDRERAATTVVRLLDGDLQLRLLVGPRDPAPVAAARRPEAAEAAEDVAEQVLDVDALGAAGARPRPGAAARASARPGPVAAAPGARSGPCPRPRLRVDVLGHLAELVAERVVAPPGVGVRQHVVGLGDLLEARLRAGVLVDVGVGGAGQLPVGALDLVGRRVARHAEHLVEVAPVGHQAPLRPSAPSSSSSSDGRARATTTPAGRRTASPLP